MNIDTQKHSIVYYDKHISTLNEGVRILYHISNPILMYKQRISVQNPSLDLSYSEHFSHNPSQHLFYLTFPSLCSAVSNFTNNYGCKMAIYHKNNNTGFIKEIQLTQTTSLNLIDYKDVQMLVYTDGKEDLIITFNVYLCKNSLKARL